MGGGGERNGIQAAGVGGGVQPARRSHGVTTALAVCLHGCRALYITDSPLSGTLPGSGFSDLGALQWLLLSRNNLAGTLPRGAFAALTSLVGLYLDHKYV